MLILSPLNKDWRKMYFEGGSSYLVCLRCLCVCNTTYWVLLRDQKLTSFISMDSESFTLGQQLQGGISKHFPPWNPSCFKEVQRDLSPSPRKLPMAPGQILGSCLWGGGLELLWNLLWAAVVPDCLPAVHHTGTPSLFGVVPWSCRVT